MNVAWNGFVKFAFHVIFFVFAVHTQSDMHKNQIWTHSLEVTRLLYFYTFNSLFSHISLSLYGKVQQGHSAKQLFFLCFTNKRKSYKISFVRTVPFKKNGGGQLFNSSS